MMSVWAVAALAFALAGVLAVRGVLRRRRGRARRLRFERRRKRLERMERWATANPEDSDLELADEIAREVNAERWPQTLRPLTHTRARSSR